MNTRHSFESLVDLVLSERCSVETAEGVPGWPTGATVSGAVISILMHRDVPGAVALFGEVDGVTVLTGAFSGRLKDFVAAHHAARFRFDSCRSPEAAIRFLFSKVAGISESRREDENFRFVCGVEGAELLASLKRVSEDFSVLH